MGVMIPIVLLVNVILYDIVIMLYYIVQDYEVYWSLTDFINPEFIWQMCSFRVKLMTTVESIITRPTQ